MNDDYYNKPVYEEHKPVENKYMIEEKYHYKNDDIPDYFEMPTIIYDKPFQKPKYHRQ